jgi:hypothetical protein
MTSVVSSTPALLAASCTDLPPATSTRAVPPAARLAPAYWNKLAPGCAWLQLSCEPAATLQYRPVAWDLSLRAASGPAPPAAST